MIDFIIAFSYMYIIYFNYIYYFLLIYFVSSSSPLIFIFLECIYNLKYEHSDIPLPREQQL